MTVPRDRCTTLHCKERSRSTVSSLMCRTAAKIQRHRHVSPGKTNSKGFTMGGLGVGYTHKVHIPIALQLICHIPQMTHSVASGLTSWSTFYQLDTCTMHVSFRVKACQNGAIVDTNLESSLMSDNTGSCAQDSPACSMMRSACKRWFARADATIRFLAAQRRLGVSCDASVPVMPAACNALREEQTADLLRTCIMALSEAGQSADQVQETVLQILPATADLSSLGLLNK